MSRPDAPPRRRYLIRREDATPAAGRPAEDSAAAAEPEDPADRIGVYPIWPFAKSRHDTIADAAWLRAVRRGFRDGSPEQDWLEAEAEIEALLRQGNPVAEPPR